MKSETRVINTKDWLNASKELNIRLYVENSVSTVTRYQYPPFNEGLRDISKAALNKPSMVMEPGLETEFEAWEILSDQALADFERALG